MVCAELFDGIYDKFLNQVGTVRDTSDEGRAGNCSSTKWESWTDRTNKKRGHTHGDQRKLPDAGRDSEVVGFAEIQGISD